LREPDSPNKLEVMKRMMSPYLIHGIVETGEVRQSDRSEVLDTRVAVLREVLERAMSLPRHASTGLVSGGWRIAAQTSFAGGRLAVRLYAPGMDPAGACAASMSVSYAAGKPPTLWTSRAGIPLAPDPSKVATEIGDLELGLAWAWIPLVEAWIDEDWARTLDATEGVLEQGRPRELAGSGGTSAQEEEWLEHEEARIDEERETDEWEVQDDWDLLDYWEYKQWLDDMSHSYGDSPEDWAPVDVKQDWYRNEPDAQVPYHDHEDAVAGWDFLDEWDEWAKQTKSS